METLLVLILLLSPFVGFLINLLVGKKLIGRAMTGIIATTAVIISFVISLIFFIQVLTTGEAIHVNLFQWIALGEFTTDFAFTLDQLSLLWLLFVTGIGALIHIYSIGYMKDDEDIDRYFAYLNLFIFFMSVLVSGGNLLIMFIGWEGVGLCSYLLIGFWSKDHKNNDAAKKAFIMNRIGDLGFLIGIFTLGYLFKTVDYVTLKEAVSTTSNPDVSALLGVATFALFIGATGKSAQIPLYTWLPDAMAGPTPVSALIHAATMVTAGIFMVTRLNFLFDLTPDIQTLIAIVGAVTALFAASIALAQTDIKKVLAYSTVSQLGLMFLALGLGAYHVAVFHVITHAFFKACLFLGSGSVIHAMGGEQDMRKMGGLKSKMKTTYYTFLISTLSIAGIPPLAGFFSKDEIMLTAFEHNKVLWIIAALASLLTAFYMFRLLYLTFFKEFRGTEEQKHHLHESPKSMTLPLIVLAFLAFIGGAISIPFGNLSWLNGYLEPIIQGITDHHPSTGQMITTMVISTVIAIIGIVLAYYKYIKKSEVPAEDDKITGFAKVLYNKYYIDEIYNTLFVKPTYALANFFDKVIEPALKTFFKGGGLLVESLTTPAKRLQNGSLGFYMFFFVLGFCALIIYLFLV
ncbi:NADH-quinone oxidoreductase subunit L [Dysgonomonas sp. PFB1-18]|uniref:NADH-quinone oxidoreductase subunit L n=1 Tax=unclassified Dysgonomonas TaxID=2630389 RepID=UPI0024767678|nr:MULTISPECIES: NADH-quinone oxidoreductase subunit L [unclassified Dysgonomonas]MDH6307924.1 NADH-quinone oxidoreductase subunit L [Dysgonomonas sp. PF1-14]MDH6337842.1 NADH-quinone oxidoreductase subunit L [Dysgonomonas sp. PF1-16]MDH6379066.1 NADH-quinone oxidoreductase subunit L [Dysgonomonas sp. PFB1-18]MDH6396701.1 NADH-quinone oxidoreductase subunit L [Dysgonomonas sp. PF1-23]